MAMKETKENQEKENMIGTKEAEKKETKKQGLDNTHYKDASGKTIFEDPILCSQFLRDYVDIPILKDVQPEDTYLDVAEVEQLAKLQTV